MDRTGRWFLVLAVFVACGSQPPTSTQLPPARIDKLVAEPIGSGVVIVRQCPFALNCLPPVLDVATIARRLRRDKQGGVVEIELWSTLQQKYLPSYFWKAGAASLGLSPDDEMVKSSWHTSSNGVETTRYVQNWHGIRVGNAAFVLTTVNQWVMSGHGQLATHIEAATTPIVPAATALNTAMATQPVTWEWVADPSKPAPTGSLEIYSPDFGATKPFVLAWKFQMTSTDDAFVVRIDATTGAVVDSTSLIRTGTDVSATGVTAAGQTVTITDMREVGPTSYHLREAVKRQIATMQGLGGNDFTQSTNTWTAAPVRPGISAHWAIEHYWDWLAESFGRAGIDGDSLFEMQIEANGDCGGKGPNTNATSHVVKLCGLPRYPGPPVVDPLTIGHELTHALVGAIMSKTGFASMTESLAIEEGLADSLGVASNASATGTVSWVMLPGTTYARHLDNPSGFGQPSKYQVPPWNPTSTDGHTNGIVIGHWFYLLWNAISPPDAARLLYETIHAMTPTMTLVDLRQATIATAETLPGFSPEEPDAIGSAWDAVNVLDPLAATINHYPHDGQEDILPWNFAFSFDMPLNPKSTDEDQWRVEVSSTEDFSSSVQSAVYTRTDAPTFYLDAMTHYYWRVKAHHYSTGHWDNASAFKAQFETSRAAPSDVRPDHNKTGVGPWPVTFSWSPVFGADKYEVELADDDNMADNVRSDHTTSTSLTLYARPGKQQYWRVRASHGAQLGDWSTRFQSASAKPTLEEGRRKWSSTDALSFVADDPKPDLIAPAKNATVSPWQVALSWSNIHASEYEVEITKAGGSADTYPPIGFGDSDAKTLSNDVELHMSQSYSWRVRGSRAGDWAGWSTAEPFKTDDAHVKFTSPANGAEACPWPAITKWDAVPGATGYQEDFAHDNDSTFSAPLMKTGSASHPVVESSDTLLALAPGHTYYWRVRAFGPNGDIGAWSNVAGATKQGFHPSDCTVARPLSPVAQALVDPLHVDLHWKEVVDNKTTYRYKIVRFTPPAPTTPPPWVDAGTSTEVHVTQPLDYNVEYNWFIQATRGSAGGSGWSTYETFQTEKKPPPCGQSFKSGTNVGADYFVDLGKPGNFNVSYNFFTVSDAMEIRDTDANGPVLWPVDCTGGTDSRTLHSASGRIHVSVDAHCADGGTTDWTVTVGCAH